MNKKMLPYFTTEQKERLNSLPFFEAIRYWVEINDVPHMFDSTRTDRLYRLNITKKIVQECPVEMQNKTLAEIEYSDLLTMYKILKSSKTFRQVATTRKKWQTFIEMIYKHLFALGVIDRNPTYGWARENGKSKRTSHPDERALKNLFTYQPRSYEERRDLTLFKLAASIGVRIRPMCDLMLDDVKIIKQKDGQELITTIAIRKSKYGAKYDATIDEYTSTFLLDYIRNIRPNVDSEYLFISEDGEPLKRRNAEKRLELLCIRAGVPHMTPHQMRVVNASHVAEKTDDVEVVKQRLHVSSDDVARRYIHDARERKRRNQIKNCSVVEDILRGEGEELANAAQDTLQSASDHAKAGALSQTAGILETQLQTLKDYFEKGLLPQSVYEAKVSALLDAILQTSIV